MEFVSYKEAIGLLKECGVSETIEDGGDRLSLRLDDAPEAVHLHLATSDSTSPPVNGADVVPVDRDRMGCIVEHLINKLHLHDVLVLPVGKWRKVFDAVAFSLAGNEDWQEIDATATVELNTRDPLLCGPGDFHTIGALIKALLTDAQEPDQGLIVTTTAAPVVVEVVPDGVVRISVGSQALADQVVQTVHR